MRNDAAGQIAGGGGPGAARVWKDGAAVEQRSGLTAVGRPGAAEATTTDVRAELLRVGARNLRRLRGEVRRYLIFKTLSWRGRPTTRWRARSNEGRTVANRTGRNARRGPQVRQRPGSNRSPIRTETQPPNRIGSERAAGVAICTPGALRGHPPCANYPAQGLTTKSPSDPRGER